MWTYLPDVVLEEIFHFLTWRDRLSCALVCRNWYNVFYSPWLWRTLVVTPDKFTIQKFTQHQGYRQEINHRHVQLYLDKVGPFVQHITILPNNEYFNVLGFIRVLYSFLEFFDDYPMPVLETFRFSFGCENITPMGYMITGTGGHILNSLKRLLHDFKTLKRLQFNNLLLNSHDAHGVLEHLQTHSENSLEDLEIVNFTLTRYPLFSIVVFHCLRKLTLSPQNLTDDLTIRLVENTAIENIKIIQNKYTPILDIEPVSLGTWWQVKICKPSLRVQLVLEGNQHADGDILIQENAPVDEILYLSEHYVSKSDTVVRIADEYRNYLRKCAYYKIPRKHGGKSFTQRSDCSLVLLVRECPQLQTLVINCRISTATLLVMAKEGKCLKKLIVRRNAVILRSDWPLSPEWSSEFCMWLKGTARDYTATEKEVGCLLGDPCWRMLSDKEFVALCTD